MLSFLRAGAVLCPRLTECVAAQNGAMCFYKIKENKTFRIPEVLYLSLSGIFRKIRSKNSTASLPAEATTT